MTKTTFLKYLLLIIAIGISSFGAFATETTFFSFSGSSGYLAPPASGWTNAGTVEGGTYLKLAAGSIISPEYQPAHSLTFKYDIASFGSGSGTVTKLYILNASDNTVITEFTLFSASSSTYTTNQTVTIPTISSVFKIKIEGEGNGSAIRATRLRNFSLVGTFASSCTASTLSFAEATINKTMGDAAFTITATSLNATTAITYESDNTAAATVNETTGEVTIVGVGAAKIKATQAAGTHASVDYCAATAEYTLNVTTNLPTITVTEVLPAFTANVGASDQKTLTVTGANLTADIAFNITGDNAAMFGVTTSLPASGGSATITYNPTAPGAHTATLTINSDGATDVLVTLNGTSALANAVATDATAVNPTSFTANWNAVAGATGYVLNVFTGNYLINESFASITSGNSTSTSGSSTGWDGNENFTAVAAAYKAGGAVKLGTSSAIGSITTKAIDLTNATSLKFDVKGWTTVEGDIIVTVDALDPIVVTYTAIMAGAFETKTITLPAATATSTVKFATSAKRAFIDNIAIGSSSFVHENLVLGNVTSYNVTNLTVDTDYYYTVTAKHNEISSAKSNEIKVTTSETTNITPSATMQSLRKVGNQIVFETSAQQSVEIFNATGQRLMSTTTVDGVNAITVNTIGLVLVKIGKNTVKVIM